MKRIFTRTLATLMTVVMLVGVAPLNGFVGLELPDWLNFSTKASALAETGQCGENVYWKYDLEKEELFIFGTGETYNYSYGQSPFYNQEIDAFLNISEGVTSIGSYLFQGTEFWNDIYIPGNIQYIDEYAFSHSVFFEVHFSEGLKRIEKYAFENIGEYETYWSSPLSLPDSLTYIDDLAFAKTPIEYASMGNGLTEIPDALISKALVSFEIGKNVERIQDYAFSGCTELSGLYLPEGIKYIGNGAFSECNNIGGINYPESLEEIGSYLFSSCDSIQQSGDIHLGKNIKKIGIGSFAWTNSRIFVDKENKYYCSDSNGVLFDKNMTVLKYCPFTVSDMEYIIPDGVIKIEPYAFNCSYYTTITVPKSVQIINERSFVSYCDEDVFGPGSNVFSCTIKCYSGSVAEQFCKKTENYEYGRIDCIILDDDSNPYDPVNGIYIGKIDNNSVKYTYKYSDYYFDDSAYEFNHNLATMSLCFATAAMVSDGGPYSDKHPEGAYSMFKKIEFNQVEDFGYNKKPEKNSIACVFANKPMDDGSIVIAVGIRGGGYEGEWGGNFNIGTGVNHEGFDIAKNAVLDYLNRYIKENNDKADFNSHKVKFWVTGYSRSAAVANLVAAELNNYSTTGNSIYDEINKLDFDAEGIYAYTFETPRNTRNSNKADHFYDNIFNIVNPIDPVPMVAPSAWGYGRFGRDCYLPSKNTYNNYSELCSRMKESYKRIAGKDYIESFKFYEIQWDGDLKENPNIGQESFVSYLLNTMLASEIIKSPEEFYNKYQSAIMDIVYAFKSSVISDQSKEKAINQLKKDIIGWAMMRNVLPRTVSIYKLKTILAEAGQTATNDEVTFDTFYNLLGKLDDLLLKLLNHPNYVVSASIYGIKLFVPPHETQTCLAWMDALYGEDYEHYSLFNLIARGEPKYRNVIFNCPIDISVYDSRGQLRGAIINDEVQNISEEDLNVYIDENGQKVFVLPADEEYTFTVCGTDSGKMNCVIEDVNASSSETEQTISFLNIDVSKDSTFDLNVSECSDELTDAEMYQNGNLIEPTERTENPDEYLVEVNSSSDNCSVSGGGLFKKGEYAKVVAIGNSEKNEVFYGWYANNILVSKESEYRFMVTDNIKLTAKFSQNINPVTVRSVSVSDVQINYKKSATLNPTITADEGVTYTVKYESSNPKVATVDQNGNVYGAKKGSADIKVTVTDSAGNTVTDTCNVKVKYSFGQWLIVILLFGWIWY